MEPMEPSSVEALSLEAMEAQFIAPPMRLSMRIDDNAAQVAIARRTGLEECRARLEAAAASQWEYALLPTGTYLPPSYLPPSSAMTHDNVHGAPDRAWVQQVAREAVSSREVREAAATAPWAVDEGQPEGWPEGWLKDAMAGGWLSVDAAMAAADAARAAAGAEAQGRGGGGPAAVSSGWAAAVDIPPWHSPQIRRWCAARARIRPRPRPRPRPLALVSPS